MSAAALTVRAARASDLAPLGFFFDSVLRRDYFLRRGQIEEMIRGRHHSVWVAEIDSVLVGVAITTGGSTLVNALVHPAYRGLRIGRALVEHSGARRVRAKLDMSTGDPRGFYHKLGFEDTGRRNERGNIALLERSESPRGLRRERGSRGEGNRQSRASWHDRGTT